MNRHVRAGFTRVELLLVLAIVGMLIVPIFPVFESMRERARQETCSKNIGARVTATLSYESTAKHLPGLVEANGKSKSRGNEWGHKVSWGMTLLDRLGDDSLAASWSASTANGNSFAGDPQREGRVQTFICPSDSTIEADDLQPLSYVANAGLPKDAEDPAKCNVNNGVFFSRYGRAGSGNMVTLKQMEGKGADYTILFAENLQAYNFASKGADSYDGAGGETAVEAQMYTGFVWNGYGINMGDGDKEKDQVRIAPNVKWARPSSNHPNGVYMALCSGRVRFVRENIEAHVFRWLCVSNVPRSDLDKSDLCKKPGFSVSDGDF